MHGHVVVIDVYFYKTNCMMWHLVQSRSKPLARSNNKTCDMSGKEHCSPRSEGRFLRSS